MKNLSLILNVVLIAAVAYLYIDHFSATKKSAPASATEPTEVSTAKTDSTPAEEITAPIITTPSVTRGSKVVYVNVDELNEKYEFLADLTKNVKARQARIEGEYQAKTQKFQTEYQEYQKSAQAGIATKMELSQKEESLKRQNEEIVQMETQMRTMAQEVQSKNEDMYKTMIAYLKEYNKKHSYNYILGYAPNGGSILLANDSLDITNDILTVLNEQYRAKKKK